MKKLLSKVIALSVVVAGLAFAADVNEPQTVAKSKIESLLGLTVTSVANSPVDGLLQVMTNRGLFYVSDNGTYLLHGNMYNLDQKMRNETETALSGVRVEGVKGFENQMIEFKAENERYTVSVFTDITCGYCRKLHNEIASYNEKGITVRYLAFPRNGLQGQSFADMVSVWCSDDQQNALTKAKAGDTVESKSCETTVEDQYNFGLQVGVKGTPALVLSDGSMVPGYQPADELVKVLATL